MDEGGRNITPDKLSPAERAKLYSLCDEALKTSIEALRPRWVIGIGNFAETRAREALRGEGGPTRIGRISHPSPASPAANRGWEALAERELQSLGIDLDRFRD
jgi:single-strand selective monofunctional uracil DNA glycosylase